MINTFNPKLGDFLVYILNVALKKFCAHITDLGEHIHFINKQFFLLIFVYLTN